MSARVRPPSVRVKEAPLLVFSALNGLAHRAAKRIAFWRTSRVLGVICIADLLQDLSERDQKAAKEAYESFSELVTRFPESRYAPDAAARMRYTVNALAQYEVHVARYYYNRAAYVAAISRAQQALKDYRDAPALQEALLILANSYDKLGMTDLRDDARRVLELNYPNSTVAKPDKPWWKIW